MQNMRTGAGCGRPDALLVSMPFGPIYMPSIALGILQAVADQHGYSVRSYYANLEFAKWITPELYTRITGNPVTHMTGEWIFSHGVFPNNEELRERYISEVLWGEPGSDKAALHHLYPDSYVAQLFQVSDLVESFLDSCLRRVLSIDPRIVGFTSVFEQNLASLALAKRIKEARPDITIIMGGANCEGAMGQEILQQFGYIDAVVSGEGESSFLEILNDVSDDGPTLGSTSVYWRENLRRGSAAKKTGVTLPRKFAALDDLPRPTYEDYFNQVEQLDLPREVVTAIPFETSRGCWWGEKHHCTFCGLNGGSLAYRSKTAERALDELVHLSSTYPALPFSVVDNILDYRYFNEFLPRLGDMELNLDIFYEVKANIRKDQLAVMRRAGIKEIQPGIESLSSNVLKLMRKGVTGIQNIQLLKWCRILGIEVQWNLLWGFPEERPEDYNEMADIVPSIVHLTPPSGVGNIRLDRFSPYFESPSDYGVRDIRPLEAAHLVYREVDAVGVYNLSYYFRAQFQSQHNPSEYTAPLVDRVREWRRQYPISDLLYRDVGPSLLVIDYRPIALRNVQILDGLKKCLVLECDQIRTRRQLLKEITQIDGVSVSEAEVVEAIDDLINRRLLIAEGGQYLSLVLPTDNLELKPKVAARLAHDIAASRTGGVSMQLQESGS